MTTPTSPIMEHNVKVSQLEGSNMTMEKELLEDPQIQPGMKRSALSVVTSLFTPNKLTPTAQNDETIVPNKVP